MIIALIVIGGVVLYTVIGIVVARAVAGHVAWKASDNYGQSKPDKSDWSAGYELGIPAGIFWPLFGPGWLIYVAVKGSVLKLWHWADQRVAVGAERGRKQ